MLTVKIEDEDMEIDGSTYSVACTVMGTCYFESARLSGPPEDCSPEEAECDIHSIDLDECFDAEGDLVRNPDLLKAIAATFADSGLAEAALWGAYNDQGPEEPDYDDSDDE